MQKPSRKQLWLSHFLDHSNKSTFLKKSGAAIAAGYSSPSSSGSANYKYFKDKIAEWLDEVGLSETTLKIKLATLLDAKETKFFAHQGVVVDEREVEALGLQLKALDMAFKVKGSYAPEKHEYSNMITEADGCIKSDTDLKDAANIYAQMIKQDD
jgi:hypothetical protein